MEVSPALRESRGEEECPPTRTEDSIADVEELDVAACRHDAVELVFDDSPFGVFLNGLRRHDGEQEEEEEEEVGLGGMAVDSGPEKGLDTLESLMHSERDGSHAIEGDANRQTEHSSKEAYGTHEVVHFNADEVLSAAQTQEVPTGEQESSAVEEPSRGPMNAGYGSFGLGFRIHAMAEHVALRLGSQFVSISRADGHVSADGRIENLQHCLPPGLCTLRRCLLSCNDVYKSIVDKLVGSGIMIGGRTSLDHRYDGNNGWKRAGLDGFYSLFVSRGDGNSSSAVPSFTTHLGVEITIILLLSVWCAWLWIYLILFAWNKLFLTSILFENGLYISATWFIIIFLCVAFHQYQIVRLYTAADNLARTVESVGSGLREYNQSLSNAFAHLYELELVSRGLRVSIRHTPVERLERAGRIRATEYLKRTLRETLISAEEELVGAIKEISAHGISSLSAERVCALHIAEDMLKISNAECVCARTCGIPEGSSIRDLKSLRTRIITLESHFLHSLVNSMHICESSSPNPHATGMGVISLALKFQRQISHCASFLHSEADLIRHTLRPRTHASEMHTLGRASCDKRIVSSEATVRARKFVDSCEKQRDCMQSAAARFQCCVNELLTLVEDAPEGPYDVSQLSQVSNLYENALEDVKSMIVLWHQGRSTLAELVDPSSMEATCKEGSSGEENGETGIPCIQHYEEEPRPAPQREEFEGYTGEQSASALEDDDDDGPYRPLRPPARTAASSMPPLPPIPTNGGIPVSGGDPPIPPPPPPPLVATAECSSETRSLPRDGEQSGLASLLQHQSKLLPTMAEELIAAGAAEGSAMEVGIDGAGLLVSELKQVLRARREGDER